MYNFTISTTDPDGDRVMYEFDWTGDGWVYSCSGFYESGETVTIPHIFENEGRYEVKVKAIDENGDESEWSDKFLVIVDSNNVRDDDSSKESKGQDLDLFPIMIVIIIIILIIIGVLIYWRFRRIS